MPPGRMPPGRLPHGGITPGGILPEGMHACITLYFLLSLKMKCYQDDFYVFKGYCCGSNQQQLTYRAMSRMITGAKRHMQRQRSIQDTITDLITLTNSATTNGTRQGGNDNRVMVTNIERMAVATSLLDVFLHDV